MPRAQTSACAESSSACLPLNSCSPQTSNQPWPPPLPPTVTHRVSVTIEEASLGRGQEREEGREVGERMRG